MLELLQLIIANSGRLGWRADRSHVVYSLTWPSVIETDLLAGPFLVAVSEGVLFLGLEMGDLGGVCYGRWRHYGSRL